MLSSIFPPAPRMCRCGGDGQGKQAAELPGLRLVCLSGYESFSRLQQIAMVLFLF